MITRGIEAIAKGKVEIPAKDLKALSQLTTEAFGKLVPLEEVRERTKEADFIFLIRNHDKIIGYAMNALLLLNNQRVNYFIGGVISAEVQNNGLYLPLNKQRLQSIPADIVMTRTQNPKVYSGFARLCSLNGYNIYPSGKEIPSEIIDLARDFTPDTCTDLICRGVYGRELMSNTPKPSNGTQDLFSKLEKENGDAYIIIGKRD